MPRSHPCVCMSVRSVTQSCPTLCNPKDYSPPGSSVHGILQARILEWIAISSSRGSFQFRELTRVSCISWLAGRFFTIELPWWPSGKRICYSCLGNPMDRGTWRATAHGVAKELDTTEWLNNNRTRPHLRPVNSRSLGLDSQSVVPRQELQHHLGTCEECRFFRPTPDVLNHYSGAKGRPGVQPSVLCKLPRLLGCSSSRTAALGTKLPFLKNFQRLE